MKLRTKFQCLGFLTHSVDCCVSGVAAAVAKTEVDVVGMATSSSLLMDANHCRPGPFPSQLTRAHEDVCGLQKNPIHNASVDACF